MPKDSIRCHRGTLITSQNILRHRQSKERRKKGEKKKKSNQREEIKSKLFIHQKCLHRGLIPQFSSPLRAFLFYKGVYLISRGFGYMGAWFFIWHYVLFFFWHSFGPSFFFCLLQFTSLYRQQRREGSTWIDDMAWFNFIKALDSISI